MSKSTKTCSGMSNEVLHVGKGEEIAGDKKLKEKKQLLTIYFSLEMKPFFETTSQKNNL